MSSPSDSPERTSGTRGYCGEEALMIEPHGGHVPKIHPTAWDHATAVLNGEVELADRVSVWPTAVLRGDMGLIAIGSCSNVQDGAICHDTGGRSVTRIGARVTIGHRAILHGCVVEDECLIGMGSIILDNAVIGTGSVIAAGAVVPPGKVIPPRSMVMGAPGRIVRPAGPQEAEMIAMGWTAYLDKLSRYARVG
jgi:carbonic anhydrase/acetyltransferase-like protein (isoleucine patch superfamily)